MSHYSLDRAGRCPFDGANLHDGKCFACGYMTSLAPRKRRVVIAGLVYDEDKIPQPEPDPSIAGVLSGPIGQIRTVVDVPPSVISAERAGERFDAMVEQEARFACVEESCGYVAKSQAWLTRHTRSQHKDVVSA